MAEAGQFEIFQNGFSLDSVLKSLEKISDEFLGIETRVISGSHKLSRFQVKGKTVVGSNPEDDVVLLADHLEPSHFELIPQGSVFNRKVRVSAKSGGIMMKDGLYIGPGQWETISLPAKINANGVDFSIEMKTSDMFWKRVAATILLLVGLLMAIASAQTLISNISNWSFFANASAPRWISGDLNDGNQQLAKTVSRLEILGLGKLLTVREIDESTIMVEGKIASSDTNNWQAFLQWFDDSLPNSVLVRQVSVQAGDILPEAKSDAPAFSTIWFDDTGPVAEMSDGSTVSVGDKVAGGWRVDDITYSGISLSRGSERINLRISGSRK